MSLTLYLVGWALMSGALVIADVRVRRMRRERDQAMLALRLNIARAAGAEAVQNVLADFQHHVHAEGVEFDDADDAAHAFADFLANQTGQSIIAQVDGGGIIVAIPDQEAT